MGAGQSSGSSDARVDQEVKTSYYELLGVQRQATEDEIKKAYRRKALELHPDRNYGNEEEATKIFSEVQAAYEILSDAQERAWYDSHESAILRGEDGNEDDVHTYQNVRVTTADDLARVLRKFNSNVEFTDAPSGFFGFLSEQFEQLAKEEDIAASWEDVDSREYPPFGHSSDTHDDVVKKFYAAWTSFSTVKSFAWKDKYRLSEAPDRRIRRLMEKENSNLRQEAIREFNDAVRTFVLFVRKRDPRYTPSTQSEAERQKLLREAAAAQAARARAKNQAAMQGEVPAWTQYREPEELEESEEEVDEEIIECVACNKTFKSEPQYKAHEKSKKHQKAIQALQRQMRKDNAKLDLDDAPVPPSDEADWDIVDVSGDNLEANSEHEGSPAHHVDDDQAQSTSIEDEVSVIDHRESDSPTELHDVVSIDTSVDKLTNDLERSAILDSVDDDSDSKLSSAGPPKKKQGKAAQKRARKAAAASSSSAQEDANNHKCATCDAAFPSRTRLFQHIKDHNHAALKPGGSGVKKTKKK